MREKVMREVEELLKEAGGDGAGEDSARQGFYASTTYLRGWIR